MATEPASFNAEVPNEKKEEGEENLAALPVAGKNGMFYVKVVTSVNRCCFHSNLCGGTCNISCGT